MGDVKLTEAGLVAVREGIRSKYGDGSGIAVTFESSVDSLMQQEIAAIVTAERARASRILEGVLATVSLHASDADRKRMNELPGRIRSGE